MVRVEQLVQLLVGGATIVVLGPVELLVHGLQFGMEEAQHGLLHTLALDGHPPFQFIAGDIVDVDRTLSAGVGVGAPRPDALDHLVVLVGDGIGGGHGAEAVDAAVDAVALGLVGGAAALLVGIADLLQHGALLGPIGGGDAAGTFEEHVLQVVGQASGIGGIVLATRPHSDVGLDARCIGVPAEPYL